MNLNEYEAASKGDKFLYLYNEVERIKRALNITDKPKVQPAPWSNTANIERDWKPVASGDIFWTDLSGNVVRRDEVPEDVIAKWEAGRVSEGNGETE